MGEVAFSQNMELGKTASVPHDEVFISIPHNPPAKQQSIGLLTKLNRHNHNTWTTSSLIQNSGVIACLRANSAELAYEAATAALNGGISVLEIVMSTPGVFQVLRQLVKDYPTLALGVGTALNAEDARNAMNAGAKFFMSPATVKDIMDDVVKDEILYIPGVMTPTEILSAYDAGAKMVKVYPVSALGGVQYISALKKPFPHIPMVASQGIMIDSIGEYISSGASSVVLSDAIFDKGAMTQRNFNVIHQLASLAALEGKEAVERVLQESCCYLLSFRFMLSFTHLYLALLLSFVLLLSDASKYHAGKEVAPQINCFSRAYRLYSSASILDYLRSVYKVSRILLKSSVSCEREEKIRRFMHKGNPCVKLQLAVLRASQVTMSRP
ncbi:hypothetical protein D5086_000305 [Populus alba]|uniref:Uncharacterized protein n=1 Tax=Populus alba TaxID=43335 RepID=A0ACC4CWZ7_POPAL